MESLKEESPAGVSTSADSLNQKIKQNEVMDIEIIQKDQNTHLENDVGVSNSNQSNNFNSVRCRRRMRQKWNYHSSSANNSNINSNTSNSSNKRYNQHHHFNNGNLHYQHHKSNNHFNNNRHLRKALRNKREQWINRKLAKESLNNQQLCKRLVPAPYNTTQFLMDDHNVREPDLDEFKKLIRKDESDENLPQTNNENNQQPRLNDRLLHTLNDESSSEEFYSSPDDEQDFMEKQFSETYDSIHAERLGLMSKNELIEEYLFLEGKVNVLEDQLKSSLANNNLSNKPTFINTFQYNSESATEEEQSNRSNILNATVSLADTGEEYTNSSLSQINIKNEEDSQLNEDSSISKEGVNDKKISLEQLKNEIKRLIEENSNLKKENDFLKKKKNLTNEPNKSNQLEEQTINFNLNEIDKEKENKLKEVENNSKEIVNNSKDISSEITFTDDQLIKNEID